MHWNFGPGYQQLVGFASHAEHIKNLIEHLAFDIRNHGIKLKD
jgi:hypothetical protein